MRFIEFLVENDWDNDDVEHLRAHLYRKQEGMCHQFVLFLFQHKLNNTHYAIGELTQDFAEREPQKMFNILDLIALKNDIGATNILAEYPKMKELWKSIIQTKEKYVEAGGILF